MYLGHAVLTSLSAFTLFFISSVRQSAIPPFASVVILSTVMGLLPSSSICASFQPPALSSPAWSVAFKVTCTSSVSWAYYFMPSPSGILTKRTDFAFVVKSNVLFLWSEILCKDIARFCGRSKGSHAAGVFQADIVLPMTLSWYWAILWVTCQLKSVLQKSTLSCHILFI